jgi:hypothetical protein
MSFAPIAPITVNTPFVSSGRRPRLRVKRPGAKPVYDSAALLTALKRIWFAIDQMCSKKLKAAISLWLPHYEQEYGALQEPSRRSCFA